MKNSLAALSLAATIGLSLVSLGCLSAINPPPATAVSPTSNPLVAQYSINHFREGFSAWVEFGTDTSYGRQTSLMSNSVTTIGGQTLNILVAGMLPQTTYHMRAHVEWPTGSFVDQDKTFTTGSLTGLQASSQGALLQLPQITASAPVPSFAPAPGVELLSLIEPIGSNMMQSVVTDLQGNIIWYYPLAGIPIKLMDNGDFILNLSGSLREIDLAGNTIRNITLPQVNKSLQTNGYSFSATVFSHDVLVLPNGHLVVIVQNTKSFDDLPGYPGTTNVLGDAIIDIDPNGNVAWGWSAFDYLDVNRHLQGLPDWTHSNALALTSDGNLLLSMRHQSWILKIDYENGTGTGSVLWKLGQDGDFILQGGDPSQWFYGQHDPYVLNTNDSQMTMAVYDDGNLRIDSTGVACGSSQSAPPCYSRATIFQLDESTNSASLLWQDIPGFYSFWGGSIDVLSNGNVEFTSSEPSGTTASQIMEVTQTGSPETVWQLNIAGENAYRGTRIPSLYPGVAWQK